MKRTILISLLTLICITIFAQQYTQTVKGKIIDIDTRTSLPGATIILLDSDPFIGTISDLDGNFKLENIPMGRRSFKISYLGFEDAYINEIVVGAGSEVFIDVQLKESLTTLEEVKIVAHSSKNEAINRMATISARQITVEATSRIAAGINDPGRTAQSYAGVSSADDENNELVVRGNSPRGMLWRMEGIEIPNPNHFSNGEGGTGGGVCALSTQVLGNSDFFTGAFPAEYGNALSGVFDLQLRNGNFEKREYALQLGVLGAQFATEGPFKEGSEASYLLNYRYSTLELLSAMGIDISGGNIIPKFQDLSYKVYLPTKKIGRFSFWGLGGISSAGTKAEEDSLAWVYRAHRYSETEDHYLAISGISHNYIFNNYKTYLKTVAAYSYTNNTVTEDSLDNNYVKAVTGDERFVYRTFSVNSFLNHKFNAKNIVRLGIIYNRPEYDFYAKVYNYDNDILEKLIDNKGKTNIIESYFQWQYRLNKNIDLNSGLHYTYLFLNKDYAIEPRVGLKWKISNTSTINFGAGLHSKAEPISIYLAERHLTDGTFIYPNKNLKVTKAKHIVAGYNWNFAKDFVFKTEIYYQQLYDVPIKEGDTTGTISSLNFSSGYTNEEFVNKGTGRNYGIEFTFEKYFSNNYYFMITSSIFESKYTMPEGKERNTLFNSKYIHNIVGGKEFLVGKSKQNLIGSNIRMMWRGGYRTIPVDIEASRTQGKDIREYERAFETKAPDYFRIDIGINFQKNNLNWSWILSANIQNITNRYNIWDEYYSYESGNMEKVYMNGMIPVINYRVEF